MTIVSFFTKLFFSNFKTFKLFEKLCLKKQIPCFRRLGRAKMPLKRPFCSDKLLTEKGFISMISTYFSCRVFTSFLRVFDFSRVLLRSLPVLSTEYLSVSSYKERKQDHHIISIFSIASLPCDSLYTAIQPYWFAHIMVNKT